MSLSGRLGQAGEIPAKIDRNQHPATGGNTLQANVELIYSGADPGRSVHIMESQALAVDTARHLANALAVDEALRLAE